MTDDATSFDHDDDRVVGRTDHCGWMGEVTERVRGGGKKIKEIRKHPPEHGSKETARWAGWTSVILLQTFWSYENWAEIETR